ncbi:hypothetical protein P153DRAFT_429025 [Dothidotthia symphoricarpi CBS 119687]|uniref:Cora-domain-containing protein n=1 Tax=Dothidotthia symphoricarpi CBS 119687 TaxID=1392245 RepID=A0A6A6APB0_9PLEO|nr:uncharacterized protein P153DRAFT_429025 [Dothidotthia symphoricarpi CBS 119687]KAF2133023.1 hypothetical protein P153DRAFT_429025 [Dothidotthia symphoricarpi CBS 119687]
MAESKNKRRIRTTGTLTTTQQDRITRNLAKRNLDFTDRTPRAVQRANVRARGQEGKSTVDTDNAAKDAYTKFIKQLPKISEDVVQATAGLSKSKKAKRKNVTPGHERLRAKWLAKRRRYGWLTDDNDGYLALPLDADDDDDDEEEQEDLPDADDEEEQEDLPDADEDEEEQDNLPDADEEEEEEQDNLPDADEEEEEEDLPDADDEEEQEDLPDADEEEEQEDLPDADDEEEQEIIRRYPSDVELPDSDEEIQNTGGEESGLEDSDADVVSRRSAPIQRPEHPVVPEESSVTADVLVATDTSPADRRATHWQMAKSCAERDALVSALKELITQFVQKHFDHTLVQRCWGSVDVISKQHELDRRHTLIYTIKNVPETSYLQMHQVKGLDVPMNQCALCRKSIHYPDIDDALDHLQQAQIANDADVRLEARNDLGHWLVSISTHEWETSVRTPQDIGVAPAAPTNVPALFGERKDVTGVEYFAKVAENALSSARDELMLMAHTGESLNPVLHKRTTPANPGTIPRMTDPLASAKPSKRVLRELYLLKEEIEVVTSVFSQQRDALSALREVLDSSSFRITNQVRIQAYVGLEKPTIKGPTAQYFPKFEEDVQDLYKEAKKLAEALRHIIDIAEEGNLKAILIFTLVTIVFLPLSFVSSVFGMSTTDVRDMDSTQTLFWAIALPVTVAVGGVSLLATYGGPSIQHQSHQFMELRDRIKLITSKRQRSEDEEQIRPVEDGKVSKP